MSAIVIPGAVPPEIVARIRALMERGPLVSGKLTAVGRAKDIKENLMLPPDSAASREAVELLVGALKTNQAFQAAAWPEAMLRPLFCRYADGGNYGDHVDGAMMGDASEQVRCDVAMPKLWPISCA